MTPETERLIAKLRAKAISGYAELNEKQAQRNKEAAEMIQSLPKGSTIKFRRPASYKKRDDEVID